MEYHIFTDLDSTLIFDNKVFEKDIKALQKIVSQGAKLHVATGRSTPEINNFMDQTKLKFEYKIANNGTNIKKNNVEIFERSFSEQESENIFKIISEHKSKITYMEATVNDLVFLESGYESKYLEFKQNAHKVVDEILETKNYTNKLVNKIYFEVAQPNLDILEKELQNMQKEVFKGKNDINVVPKGVTKYTAIKHLKENHLNAKHCIVCIGDGANDVDMLKNADISFTFKHAHEKAQEVSDHIVNDVHEAIEILIQKMEEK